MKISQSRYVLYTTIIICLFLAYIPFSFANGTSGWFVPLVDVIEVTKLCSVGEAAVSIQLSEYSSFTPISGTIERWRVQIRGADGVIVRGQNVVGNSLSDPLCFNPSTDGIQVAVHQSPNNDYSPIITPTMYNNPDSGLTNLAGFHFRGYVHLLMDANPDEYDIDLISPVDIAVPSTPEFLVRTNFIPALYSSIGLSKIKLYLINQSTNERHFLEVPSSGGAGTRIISGLPNDLAEGTYLWVYHQNFSGLHDTILSTTGNIWRFIDIPTTGVTPIKSFIIDRTEPGDTTAISGITVRNIVPNPNRGDALMLMSINAEAQDLQSGLFTTTLYITDTADSVLAVVPVEHTVNPFSSVRPRDLQVTNFEIALPQARTFKAYIIATDDAGNQTTSDTETFTTPVPGTFSIPAVTLDEAYDIKTDQVMFSGNTISDGGAMILRRGTCWTQDKSEAAAYGIPESQCVSDDAPTDGFATPTFINEHQNLAADSTIFFYAFATNLAGSAYSDSLEFNTLPSAFAPDALPVPPVISILPPNNIKSDGATLGSQINSIGGSQIQSRAMCWSLSPATLPTDALYAATCAADTFTCPSTGVQVTRSGPSCAFQACPEDEAPGICLAALPVCGADAEGAIIEGSFDAQCRAVCPADDGCEPSDRLICPGGNVVTRTGPSCEFMCPTVSPAPSCTILPGSLPAEATLPFRWSTIFTGLPANSTIFYRVFAENSFGQAQSDGSFVTQELWYDFSTAGSFEVSSTFNETNESFTVTVPVRALDLSNHDIGTSKEINYVVERLNSTGLVQDSVSDSTGARRINNILFYNVPPGVSIFRITLNTSPTLYPESISPIDRTLNNVSSRIINLVNPFDINDFVTGKNDVLPSLVDPGINISFPQQVLRSGNAIDLTWNINETYPMNCRVTGPSTFGTNGIFEFDPSIDGPIASMSTGILTSAQLFELRCVEPITNSVFSTTTRINVVGRVNEI